MNRTTKRIVISLISAFVASIVISLVPENLSNVVTSVITFLVIFCAVLFGAFTGAARPAGRAAASGSSATAASISKRDSGIDSETGTVKWFNIKKGYGFITRDSGEDVFVHYRNILGSGRRSIADGQRVSFIVVDGDKGLQADEVETI